MRWGPGPVSNVEQAVQGLDQQAKQHGKEVCVTVWSSPGHAGIALLGTDQPGWGRISLAETCLAGSPAWLGTDQGLQANQAH